MRNESILNRQKQFTYALQTHFPLLDDENYGYCRMANAILESSPRRCRSCPLMNEENQSIGCEYYDLIGEQFSPENVQAAKNHVDGMIMLGLSGEFPDFNVGEMRINVKSTDEELLVYERALQFAAQAHKGAFRKGTKIPYIVHPVEASMIVLRLYAEMRPDDVLSAYIIAAAAALHDVVEDTKYTINDIERGFGGQIAELVAHESENKREYMRPEDSWQIRKEEALAHLANAPVEAKMIAVGDKLSNMRSMAEDHAKLGDKMWQKFNMKDKSKHEWYYRSLGDIFKRFDGTGSYKEYAGLCDSVFSEK